MILCRRASWKYYNVSMYYTLMFIQPSNATTARYEQSLGIKRVACKRLLFGLEVLGQFEILVFRR